MGKGPASVFWGGPHQSTGPVAVWAAPQRPLRSSEGSELAAPDGVASPGAAATQRPPRRSARGRGVWAFPPGGK